MGEVSKDIRFWLLLGGGVIAAAWAFTYAGSVDELVRTGTSGYVSMIHGLEPPQLAGGGIAGGGGNFSGAATNYGGASYGGSPYSYGR
jgi:hypothetical protein